MSHPLARFVTFAVMATEGAGNPHNIARVIEEGTPSGNPGWAVGQYGRVLSYDGVGDSHVFPTRQLINYNRPFTIATRFFPTANSAEVIYSLKSGVTGRPFALFLSNNATYNPFTWGANNTTNNPGPTTDDGSNITLNIWHDITISYNGSGTGGLNTIGNWTCYWQQNNETPVINGNFGAVTDITELAANSDGNNLNGLIDYLVVLDGIEAAHLLQRPEQVFELIRPQTRNILVGSSTLIQPVAGILQMIM